MNNKKETQGLISEYEQMSIEKDYYHEVRQLLEK